MLNLPIFYGNHMLCLIPQETAGLLEQNFFCKSEAVSAIQPTSKPEHFPPFISNKAKKVTETDRYFCLI